MATSPASAAARAPDSRAPGAAAAPAPGVDAMSQLASHCIHRIVEGFLGSSFVGWDLGFTVQG